MLAVLYKSVPFSGLTKHSESVLVVITASEIGTDSSSPKTSTSPARLVFFTLSDFSESETNVIQQVAYQSEIKNTLHPYNVKIRVANLEHAVAYARMCPCSDTCHMNINYIHLYRVIKNEMQSLHKAMS